MEEISAENPQEEMKETVETTELPTVEELEKGKPSQETPPPSHTKGDIGSEHTNENVGHASTTVEEEKELDEEEHFLYNPSTRTKTP